MLGQTPRRPQEVDRVGGAYVAAMTTERTDQQTALLHAAAEHAATYRSSLAERPVRGPQGVDEVAATRR